MRKMLVASLVALTMAGTSLGVSAQAPNCIYPDCPGIGAGAGPGGGAGPRGHHRGHWKADARGGPGMKGLNLSDEQVVQIEAIREKQREETHAQIRAVLTPEQQAIFDQRAQWRRPPAPAQ